jgi:hypothetical protein
MPLLAYAQSGEPLVAPLMTDEQWEQLRSSKQPDAWMPYGGGRAIPKVSRLGTRFFARRRGQAPEGARETDTHLFIKAQCLLGARDAGWEALPEQRGKAPDGQDWRADVLCRRPGKAWSVGLEAQVELQGEEMYWQRQARYAASGIRTLWLVAHEPAALRAYWNQPDRDLPAVRTRTWKDQDGRLAGCVHVDDASLSIADFVAGALSGQLRWYGDGLHGTVTLVVHEALCWRRMCGKTVLLASRAETRSGHSLDLARVVGLEGFSSAYARAQAALPKLADPPAPFRRGLATCCPHCRCEIRYPGFDWAPRESETTYVPLGIQVPEGVAARDGLGLRPDAGWRWGPQARWPCWAPVGDIGLISRQGGLNRSQWMNAEEQGGLELPSGGRARREQAGPSGTGKPGAVHCEAGSARTGPAADAAFAPPRERWSG